MNVSFRNLRSLVSIVFIIKNDKRFKVPKLAPQEHGKRMQLKKSIFMQLENIAPLYFYTALIQAIIDDSKQTKLYPPCIVTSHTISDVLSVSSPATSLFCLHQIRNIFTEILAPSNTDSKSEKLRKSPYIKHVQFIVQVNTITQRVY